MHLRPSQLVSVSLAVLTCACGGVPGEAGLPSDEPTPVEGSSTAKLVEAPTHDLSADADAAVTAADWCHRYNNELPSNCGWLLPYEVPVFNAKTGMKLTLQTDGNVVLRTRRNTPLWASGTAGSRATGLVVQGDGNMVLYEAGRALWNTRTNASGVVSAKLVLQDDGNLVLYRSDLDYYHHVQTHAVWQTRTVGMQNR